MIAKKGGSFVCRVNQVGDDDDEEEDNDCINTVACVFLWIGRLVQELTFGTCRRQMQDRIRKIESRCVRFVGCISAGHLYATRLDTFLMATEAINEPQFELYHLFYELQLVVHSCFTQLFNCNFFV